MKEAVIVSGSRTAIGNFGGGLMNVPVVEMGAVVMKTALKNVGLKPVATPAMRKVNPLPGAR